MSDIYCTLDAPIAVKEPETPYTKALASINVSAHIDATTGEVVHCINVTKQPCRVLKSGKVDVAPADLSQSVSFTTKDTKDSKLASAIQTIVEAAAGLSA